MYVLKSLFLFSWLPRKSSAIKISCQANIIPSHSLATPGKARTASQLSLRHRYFLCICVAVGGATDHWMCCDIEGSTSWLKPHVGPRGRAGRSSWWSWLPEQNYSLIRTVVYNLLVLRKVTRRC